MTTASEVLRILDHIAQHWVMQIAQLERRGVACHHPTIEDMGPAALGRVSIIQSFS
jgi:hypothetical protein